MIKCISIDDEPLALSIIKEYVTDSKGLDLIKEFDSSTDALEFLKEEHIDLVFLDINMPEINGMELAQLIHQKTKIIFTTAYREYAVDSYKVNAIDYLLKPFNFLEFSRAVEKAQESIKLNQSEVADSFYVKSEYRLRKIAIEELLYVENLKDYVRFHLKGGEKIMSLMSLMSVAKLLTSSNFVKVHRSYIVNVNFVKSLTENNLIMDNESLIPVSRAHRKKLKSILTL